MRGSIVSIRNQPETNAMAGTISALEVQKRNKERVNVYLDGQYAFAVTMLVAVGLRKGQFLSDADIEQLNSQDERNRAYDRAIRFLGFRPRSQAEVTRYLRDKKYSSEVITDTINRLIQQEYLDDQAFARSWVMDRQRLRPRSRRALRYELRQKGIDENVIEKTLADLDEDDLAWRALESKLRQWKHLAKPDFKKKAMGFLSRRGFNYEIVREVTDRAWESLDSSSA